MKIALYKPHLNIDTVRFRVDGVAMKVENVTTQSTTNDDGEILFRATNRKTVAGIDSRHNLSYRYYPLKRQLAVEGSLSGFLHGQNVFTTARLDRLCLEVLKVLREQLGFTAEPETLERWKAGEIHLERVDIAVNFRLDSDSQVREVLSQSACQLVRYGPMQKAGSTVYWAPRGGQDYRISMYDKGAQMGARHGPTRRTSPANDRTAEIRAAGYQRLSALCKRILRMELQLHKGALREHGIQRTADWGASTLKELFNHYLKNVPLLNVLAGAADTFDYSTVPQRQRPLVALYLLNAPVHRLYAAGSIARQATTFRKLGIDIRSQATAERTVDLTTFFEGRAMRAPKWLCREGLRSAWCRWPAT